MTHTELSYQRQGAGEVKRAGALAVYTPLFVHKVLNLLPQPRCYLRRSVSATGVVCVCVCVCVCVYLGLGV